MLLQRPRRHREVVLGVPGYEALAGVVMRATPTLALAGVTLRGVVQGKPDGSGGAGATHECLFQGPLRQADTLMALCATQDEQ